MNILSVLSVSVPEYPYSLDLYARAGVESDARLVILSVVSVLSVLLMGFFCGLDRCFYVDARTDTDKTAKKPHPPVLPPVAWRTP